MEAMHALPDTGSCFPRLIELPLLPNIQPARSRPVLSYKYVTIPWGGKLAPWLQVDSLGPFLWKKEQFIVIGIDTDFKYGSAYMSSTSTTIQGNLKDLIHTCDSTHVCRWGDTVYSKIDMELGAVIVQLINLSLTIGVFCVLVQKFCVFQSHENILLGIY